MVIFDKQEIRDCLTDNDIFDLLDYLGGSPEWSPIGIISRTICHNHPHEEASRKLYYYSNSRLFMCYSNCDTFDVFELVIKALEIQQSIKLDLNEAIRWIAKFFHLTGREEEEDNFSQLEDWKIFSGYDRIQDIQIRVPNIVLKEYDPIILTRFNYKVKLSPWLNEGISQDVLSKAQIGYYAGGDQITIPHFDKDGRFIGLRGRTLCEEDAELYGKYRPLKINNILYTHPLACNLYNFNNSRINIPKVKTAIIFEAEKSCLKYQSFFGQENDISVACCGSSISSFQMQLLLDAGAQEIIIALDRQFQAIGDDEFKRLKKKLLQIHQKYKNYVKISIIFDKNMITGYKDAPVDCGPDIFLQLYKERIFL